jgi:hypothetical protein
VFFDSLLVSRMCPTYILEVVQSEPPMLAPYQGYKATHPNAPASWGGTGKKIYQIVLVSRNFLQNWICGLADAFKKNVGGFPAL